jgi:hypothetical protein
MKSTCLVPSFDEGALLSNWRTLMRTVLRFLLSVPCLAICLSGVVAQADTFFFTDTLNGGNGTITAIADASIPNAFDVTGISGTVDGITITGLLPCAAYDPSNPCVSGGSGFLYDNLLYTQQLLPVDFTGIGFSLGNSGLEGGYGASGTHSTVLNLNTPGNNTLHADFSVVPAPEPGSFVLLGTGMLGRSWGRSPPH